MDNSLASALLSGRAPTAGNASASLLQLLLSNAPGASWPEAIPGPGVNGGAPRPPFAPPQALAPWSVAASRMPAGTVDWAGKLTPVPGMLDGPAYQTNKGTVIQLNKNPPATVLPSGPGLDHLISFADNLGQKSVCISGGQETLGADGKPLHSDGSFHYPPNRAVDVCGPDKNPNLNDDVIRQAALPAGYTHGVFEIGKDGSKHWHLQVGAGNGLGDAYDLSKHPMQNKDKTKGSYTHNPPATNNKEWVP